MINSKRLANDRPRPVSRKISETGVKNRPCLKLKFVLLLSKMWKVWTNFNKFGRFSQSSANFSSEAGAVKYIFRFPSPVGEGVRRTGEVSFFAYFFLSRKKSKSGFRGETPISFTCVLCG